MKHWLLSFLLIGGFVLFISQSSNPPTVEAVVVNEDPLYTFEFASLPPISAESFAVFDIDSGEVVVGSDIHTPRPIASVTKLFTASAAEDTADMQEEVEVTSADVATEGRAGRLEAGDRYSYQELLFPLLLESSNDAAAVFEKVVPHVSSTKTKIADASGLSSKNVATAAGLAEDVSNLYKTHRHIFDITTLKEYVGEDVAWINNSPVRDLPGYKGGKHGYTEAANRTLVAIFEEEAVSGKEFGYVVLGSDDVRSDVETLRQALSDSVRFE